MKKTGIILCLILLSGCSSDVITGETVIETTAEIQTSVHTETEAIIEGRTVMSITSENIDNDIIFFEEASDIPTPDSILNRVTFYKKESEGGIIKYTYILNENEEISNRLLNEYIAVFNCIESYTVDIQDNVIYVLNGDSLVSVMMSGYENDSYFLMVSFQV